MLKNNFEIQILTSVHRKDLIAIRDEIRTIEGLESVNLELPPSTHRPGEMSGGVSAEIGLAVISGVSHFLSEKMFETLVEKIKNVFKKTISSTSTATLPIGEMGAKNDWEVVISGAVDGTDTNVYVNSDGKKETFIKREYSINPEKTFALLIGTSIYDDKGSFEAIKPVEGNIEDFKKVLGDKRYVGLPPSNIKPLVNETSGNIRDEIVALSRKQGVDTLIIYLAGHGQYSGKTGFSLIAKDSRNIDEELYYDIPYTYIEQKLKHSTARQKIIIIDACHSGLAAQGVNDGIDFQPISGTFTLASTTATDKSFFKRELGHTYFTYYLLEAFKNGITSSNTMISLIDLYKYTKEKLTEKALPSPTYKSKLENINADKFFISTNPGFSLSTKLEEIKKLYQMDSFDECRKEYLKLGRLFPLNTQIREAHLEFEKNVQFINLVKEGDILRYEIKDYKGAAIKYQEALAIKYEESVRNKIIECLRLTEGKKTKSIFKLMCQRFLKFFVSNQRTIVIFGLSLVTGAILLLWGRNYLSRQGDQQSARSKDSIVNNTPLKATIQLDTTTHIVFVPLIKKQNDDFVNRIEYKIKSGEALPDGDFKIFDSLKHFIVQYPEYKKSIISLYEAKAEKSKSNPNGDSKKFSDAAKILDSLNTQY